MTQIWKTVVVSLLVLLTAYAPTGAQPAASGATYVAATQNPQAFVAIVTSGDKTLAYVCDGEKIAEWYRWSDQLDLDGWSLKDRGEARRWRLGRCNHARGRPTLGF
jgi:hypothetical protein